jgi:hypothetical protein
MSSMTWENFKMYLPLVGGATVLFIVLAPGLLLSLPATPRSECRLIAPLPLDATGTCVDGVYDGNDIDASNVCRAQQKCNSLTLSKTVGVGTVFVHAAVFLVLFMAIQYSMDMAKKGYFSGGAGNVGVYQGNVDAGF